MKVIIYDAMVNRLHKMRAWAKKDKNEMALQAIDFYLEMLQQMPSYEWSGTDEIISNSPLDKLKEK